MTTYTNIFTGALIAPALAAYNSILLNGNLTLAWPLETASNSNLATPIIDITAGSIGAFSLTLPPATSVGNGTFLIVNNLSAYTQLVYNNGGVLLASQAPGSVFFYYLQSNSSAAGVWFAFQYGAAIPSPSVALIAGGGLQATGSTLSQVIQTSIITTNYGSSSNDLAKLFVWEGGSGTFQLPVSNAVGPSWYVQIRNQGTATLAVEPSTGSTDQINGLGANVNLTMNIGDSAFFVTDGLGNWYTIGLGTVQPVFFNYQQVNVTGQPSTIVLGTTAGSLNKIAYKFTGALSANTVVQLPAYAQTYWINNATTGGFTLFFQVTTNTGGGMYVGQNSQEIIYSDGSNIINAVSGSGLSNPVSVVQGGTGATTAAVGLANLGGTSIGISVFSAATKAAAQSAIAAASTADATVLSLVL